MLINKLEHLNLHPLILNWISSYLSLRNQCVVVNGASSDSVQVISGVPQGSVLGPLLFSIYIDSVTSLNLSSNLVLYADDILLYMPIVNDTDCAALQSDIDKILNWTTANLMSFNSSKCKHMIISRKKSHHVASAFLGGQVLELVDHYKYLGFHLSADLSWSYHIQCICNKARKIMGILYRQFSSNVDSLAMLKLYTSFVRPHLEYGIDVWNPFLQKDIAALENVQKFALRVCFKKWSSSYEDLLHLSKLQSLHDRRSFLSLTTLFKIIHNIVYFPPDLLPPFSSPSGLRSSISVNQFKIPFARTNPYKYSFFCSVTQLWNNLPLEAITCTDLTLFKQLIYPLFS